MSDKFEFIDAEYADNKAANNKYAPKIVKMCRWLGVGRSSFNEWRPGHCRRPRCAETSSGWSAPSRSTTPTAPTGYRRAHAGLAAWAVDCGLGLVRKLMPDMGLVPCQPRPWRHCLTESDGRAGPIPDLVERDFTADAPGHKMVGDIGRMAVFGHRHRLPHQGCHRVGHG